MMQTEALKLAQRALSNKNAPTKLIYEALTAIKAALEAKDEPVAWMNAHDVGFKKSEFGNTPTIPLYTTPPQRKPLSFEQVEDCFPDEAIFSEQDGWLRVSAQTLHDIARNVEATHGITGDNNG
jgi:hypothetical protein